MSCRAEVDSVRPVREEMSWETCAEMGRLTIVFRCAETAVGVLGRERLGDFARGVQHDGKQKTRFHRHSPEMGGAAITPP